MISQREQLQSAPSQLHGVNPELVIELLKSRAGCTFPPASDGRKLALLVEGGGMRGVCSAGGLVALDALGFRNSFNAIYGVSAGAMDVAYMLSGQGVFGIQIYYKNINNRKFINFRRLRKVVDIDFLFDEIVTQVRPLDIEKVLASPSDFFIGLIDKDNAENVVLRTRDFPTEALSLLKATTALPVVYNKSVQIGSRRYIDGGLGSPVPLSHAIQAGCTDLVVFLTRPSSYESQPPKLWERRLFNAVTARGNVKLQALFERGAEETNICRRICLGKTLPPQPVNIVTFCPSETDTLLTRLTTDGRLLKQSAVEMALSTLRQFGGASALIQDLLDS